MSLLRVAFINISNDVSVTLEIKTADSVECCELLTTTPATEAEGAGVIHPAGVWSLVVPPGRMFGFISEHPVQIANPNSAAIIAISAGGKDPWPLPPPRPQLLNVPDFLTRYKGFLLTGAPPNAIPERIVMTLAPQTAW